MKKSVKKIAKKLAKKSAKSRPKKLSKQPAPPVDLLALAKRLEAEVTQHDDVFVSVEIEDVRRVGGAAKGPVVEVAVIFSATGEGDYFDHTLFTESLLWRVTEDFGLMHAPFNVQPAGWNDTARDLGKKRLPGKVDVFWSGGDELRLRFWWGKG